MKVGISTFFFYQNNYGERLEAFALQYFLKKIGITSDIFVYRAWNCDNDSCRTLRFKEFEKKYMSLSVFDNNCLPNLDNYKMFILGADQVLNVSLLKKKLEVYGQEYIDSLLLTWVPSKKKISYASGSYLTILQSDEYLKILSQFKSISLREKSVALELSSKLGRTIFSNIDPVLLLSSETWKKFEKKPHHINKFKSFELCLGYSDPGRNTKVPIDSIKKESPNLFWYDITQNKYS